MKILSLPLLVIVAASHTMADHPARYVSLQKRGGNGRKCDFSDGFYVKWSDCSDAAAKWCSAHADQEVAKGKKIDDGNVAGYMSGRWHVELYGKAYLRGLLEAY